MRKLLMLFVLLLAACGPVAPLVVETAATPVPTTVAVEVPLATALPTSQPEVLPSPVSGGGYPAAVFAAQAHLAAQLKLPTGQVQVTNITPRDWPDGCLGLAAPDQMCTAVITPGFEILFTVGTVQYTYHTDAQGKNLRQVTGHKPTTGSDQAATVLEWNGGNCAQITISDKSAFYDKCDGSLGTVPGPSVVNDESLKSWLATFAPFEADTPAGKIKFEGWGTSLATPTEQRMLAEWAKMQYQAASSGQADASFGRLYHYTREGGFAGFCDDVSLYLDGRVQVINCKGRNVSFNLSGSEMEKLFTLFDELSPIDYSQSDPAVADAMKVTFSMPALGKKVVDVVYLRLLLDHASTQTAKAAAMQQAGPQIANAKIALTDYFKALNGGDFAQAAKLYGGPTDLLQTWNPDVKDNLPAWLELGCKNNGLVCLVPRSMRYFGPDLRNPDNMLFLVEFSNADGSLFTQGPCCGETNGPSHTNFLFTVQPAGNGWQVLELPPYVP